MNEKFISVAVQMDQTVNDDKSIREWYKDAKYIQKEYSISLFPTYLFFSPNGEVVHRIVGATGRDVGQFISQAKEALTTNKQYYARMNSFNEHLGDSAYLNELLCSALKLGDLENASKISDEYLSSLSNPFERDNLILLQQTIKSTNGEVFSFFLRNRIRIDSIMESEDFVELKLGLVVLDEFVVPLFESNQPVLDWRQVARENCLEYPTLCKQLEVLIKGRFEGEIKRLIHKELFRNDNALTNIEALPRLLASRYPWLDIDLLIALEKPSYFRWKKQWAEFTRYSYDCLRVFGDKLSNREKSNIASDIFMYSCNRPELIEALKWSKQAIEEYPNIRNLNTFYYLDTYANLLYKLGFRDSAIDWERKTIDKMESLDKKLIDTAGLSEIKNNLSKMIANEPTWILY